MPAGTWGLPTALPALTGWRFPAFRAFWFAALAAAVLASIAGIHFSEVRFEARSAPYLELGLRPASGDGRMLGPPIGEAARAAGIVNGSRLIAIDGRALPPRTTREDVARLLRGPEGGAVRIRTRSPAGAARDHLLTRSGVHVAQDDARSGFSLDRQRALAVALGLLTDAIAVFAAVLLFRRRPRDPVAMFLSLGFLLLVQNRPNALATVSALGLGDLRAVVVQIAFVVFYLGIATFPGGRFEPRWTRWIPVLVLLWVASNLIDSWVVELLPPFTGSYVGSALLALSVVAIAARSRGLPPGVERQQNKWAIAGVAAGIVAFTVGASISAALPLIDDSVRHNWAVLAISICRPLSLGLYAFGILVALLRYRLYDAEAAISRSAAVAALTLTLAVIYAAASKAMETAFETNFGREAGALPGAVGAGLAVLLFVPLNTRIQAWAERRFQKGLAQLRRDLPEAVNDLRETASLGALMDEVLARIEAGVRATRSAIEIDGRIVAARGVGVHAASAADFPLIIPLRISHDGGEIGALLIGPRPDGTIPGKDERDALAEIADPVARALRIVMLREARERSLEQRLAAFQLQLDEVTVALGPRKDQAEVAE